MAEGQTYFEGETVHQTLHGERRDVLLTMTIPSETEGYRSVLVSLMDITEHKQADETLRRANDELDRRVEERTAELSKSNVRLKQEITERNRAEETLAQRNMAMEALYETSLEINAQPDLTALLQSVVQHATNLLRTQGGALSLLQPNGRSLKLVVSHNIETPLAPIPFK